MGGERAETRKIIRAAVRAGWMHVTDRGSHEQTYLECPHPGDDRCRLPVYSTPKRGQPRVLRRRVRKCPHGFRAVL